LDLTDHDESILKYTRHLSDILKPEHIEFVHIAHRFPNAVHIHLPPDLKYPTYDELFRKLNEEVRKHFSDGDPLSCEILDGPVQFDLWHKTWVKEIDLFIAGSKPQHMGRGLFPRKFVRKSFCSVLFIPYKIPENINRVWVPSDFSDSSGSAMEVALLLAKRTEQPAVINVHHVYQLPHAYYYEGFPRHEILTAVRKAAEKKSMDFMKLYNPQNITIDVHYTELSKSYIASDIHDQALHHGSDLILMGAGGRSRLSKIFLGSETEHMVQIETTVPLLIVKKKQNHVRLWDLMDAF
jgi:nucleotide-binding universal stress UspA family protein